MRTGAWTLINEGNRCLWIIIIWTILNCRLIINDQWVSAEILTVPTVALLPNWVVSQPRIHEDPLDQFICYFGLLVRFGRWWHQGTSAMVDGSDMPWNNVPDYWLQCVQVFLNFVSMFVQLSLFASDCWIGLCVIQIMGNVFIMAMSGLFDLDVWRKYYCSSWLSFFPFFFSPFLFPSLLFF